MQCNSPDSDFLFFQISTNVPHLTCVVARPRVKILVDHTSASVTVATLEMDAYVEVPSDSLGTLRFTTARCYYGDFDRVGLG